MDNKYDVPSIWRRFISMFYEGFLLVGPVFFIVFLYLFFFTSQNDSENISTLETLTVQLLIFSTVIVYFVWGWSHGRGTLPMKTLSLEIVSRNGTEINFKTALLRVFIAIPSVLTGIWLIVGLLRKDNQCPHDLWSGTMLIMARKKTPS